MANRHWYAKKHDITYRDDGFKRRVDCPCCNGKGKRIDEKTGLERDCVACSGIGVVKLAK